jgi:hypothetical protein
MNLRKISTLLLIFVTLGCKESTTSDPTPTPAPTDYSACRYQLNYSLRYSQLSSSRPTTLSYLDSTQKIRTVTLKDTSFALNVTYKYGDSVYIKLSPAYLRFAGTRNNKLIISSSLSNRTGSTCPRYSGRTTNSSVLGINTDSLATTPFGVSPQRVTY